MKSYRATRTPSTAERYGVNTIPSWGPPAYAVSGFDSPPRVLLYSHDTFGLGHLRRNLAIASHLLGRPRPFAARLLTGSPVAASWPMPAGLEVQALPAVVKTGAEEYASRDGLMSFNETRAQREAVILETAMRYAPDVLLVDHAPAGMKGELLETLQYLRNERPQTRIVLGLRDILDSPDAVCALWHEQDIYRLLETTYDGILVYGSRHLFDVVSAYRFPPSIAAKTRYCGYVARIADASGRSGGFEVREKALGPTILVTAGGGGDGYPLQSAYLEALDQVPQGSCRSILVPGPLMAPKERAALEAAASQKPGVTICPFTTDLPDMIEQADLVVAMAGYNTTAEIMVARKPAILVPRGAPRREQRLRAALLNGLGLTWAVRPEEDLVARLATLIGQALAGQRPPCQDWDAVDLGGAHRVGQALDEMLGERLTAEVSL